MAETMDKAKLKFEVRTQKDPQDETKTLFVPAIVDRSDPLSLAQVVYNAIDTGRIAEGICDQIYQELLRGNSIAFGKYFYVSLFLSGTVADAAASLTSANTVNVRLRQGNDFRVALGDFSWTNVANDKSAKIDWIVSATGVRGEIMKNSSLSVEGSGFGNTAAGVTVKFVTSEGVEATGSIASISPAPRPCPLRLPARRSRSRSSAPSTARTTRPTPRPPRSFPSRDNGYGAQNAPKKLCFGGQFAKRRRSRPQVLARGGVPSAPCF